MSGILYLCATPIGNLEDITLRVKRILGEVSCIYAEDTRHSATLLNHLGVKAPLISCHEHNEAERAAEIAERVTNGESVAYISDAGLPCISDPGTRIVQEFISRELPYTVLPGASAPLTALALSGMEAENACFTGFLPRDAKPRRERITALCRHPGALIVYESPLRIADTCMELASVWGDRPACLVREISKLHEQCVHGSLDELGARYASAPPRGECVLVVAGACEQSAPTAEAAEDYIRGLLGSGLSAKDAAKQAAAVLDMPKNEAYAIALSIKSEL